MSRQFAPPDPFRPHLESVSGSEQPRTIAAEIRNWAEKHPDHSAIVCSDFVPLSYRSLQFLIDEVRASLRQAGFNRNARIAVAMPSGPQAALAIVAIACSSVAIPLSPRQSLSEIETCFAALRPGAVLLMKGTDSAAKQAAKRKGMTIIEATSSPGGVLGFSIIEPTIGMVAAPDEPDEPDASAPAFILQTSGTAAEPKLIPFSHRNMLAAAARLQAWFSLTSQDRCLSVSPPFYSHGLKVTVFTPLLTGGSVAFPADASKFDYAEWFDDLRPTWYSAGPTLHRLILDQTLSRTDAKIGHSLRFILSGGAPLPRDVLVGLQDALAAPVVEHYGSSEAAQIAANLPTPGRSKLGTCGIPWPDTVRIVGDDGNPLPQGEHGEILVGGPTLISGYLNAPEVNSASFSDGWFKTGDVGSLDEDGFLTLHGRKNEVINRGGEKISPIEIDEALLRHPAVAEAAAFSVPHPRLGEDVAAAVVLRPGMTATPVELRRYLQDHVASFKIPRRIAIRDQLPKGMTGKVMRRRLTETFEEKVSAESQVSSPPVVGNASGENSTLIEQLTTLWERLLKYKPLMLDDNFFEKGGDSLLAMEMLTELERLTGRAVPSSILFEATTIRQLAHELSVRTNVPAKPLFQMSSRGSRAPLLFFHGDYNGGGYYTAKLADQLGSDQPLIVVAPHGIDGGRVPSTIEDMAADRLPSIINEQPKGPYRLGGYCVGGIVAFEVARLLVAAGKEVEMVAIIDPPTANARRFVQFVLSALSHVRPISRPVVEGIMAWTWIKLTRFDTKSDLPNSARGWYWLKNKIQRLIAKSKAANPAIAQKPLARMTNADWQYARAMSTYFPKPLALPVLYFSADYDAKAWRRISSDLDVVNLPGDHSEVITDPSALANHLKAHLQNSR
jgi:acyl-CoA synthetase (AMP-forming)/AMP-acid ligase II/thioesterase domain-containing protein